MHSDSAMVDRETPAQHWASIAFLALLAVSMLLGILVSL